MKLIKLSNPSQLFPGFAEWKNQGLDTAGFGSSWISPPKTIIKIGDVVLPTVVAVDLFNGIYVRLTPDFPARFWDQSSESLLTKYYQEHPEASAAINSIQRFLINPS